MPEKSPGKSQKQLAAENKELRARLKEAEETLRAISHAEVDALVVTDEHGERQIFTLQGADRSFRVLVENMGEGTLNVSRDGLILYANQRMAGMVSAPLETILGSNIQTWIAPDSRASLAALLQNSEMLKRRAELVLVANDGARVQALVSASPLSLGGLPDSFCLVLTDLTEMKLAENALRESELHLRLASEAAEFGWYTYDFPHAAGVWSAGFKTLLGLQPDQDVPLDQDAVFTGLHPEDRSGFLTAMLAANDPQGSGVFRHEYRILLPDGALRWLQVRGQTTFAGDGPARQPLNAAGVVFDITERKWTEQALQDSHDLLEQRVQERTAELSAANLNLEKAARMKNEFLASMSHELRTPLTGILGLSEVMQMPGPGRDPLTDKQRTYLTHIHNSGEHLLEMVNDILDFSSIGSGKFVLNLSSCSLGDICQSSLRKVLAQSAAKGLQLSFCMTPENILLEIDARRLQKILSNLLDNAVKFTPQGGSFGIEVTGLHREKKVQITVWDTGIGIKEAAKELLFQSFVQLDPSLARQYNGTGLGLALVRQLAELHGGSVSVESTFGAGSRFTVTLPWEG